MMEKQQSLSATNNPDKLELSHYTVLSGMHAVSEIAIATKGKSL